MRACPFSVAFRAETLRAPSISGPPEPLAERARHDRGTSPRIPLRAHRIQRARSAPVSESPAPIAARRRLDHVDLLRGLVIVIMVLDHVRAYFTEARFDPTDLARTDLALFGTAGSPTSAP